MVMILRSWSCDSPLKSEAPMSISTSKPETTCRSPLCSRNPTKPDRKDEANTVRGSPKEMREVCSLGASSATEGEEIYSTQELLKSRCLIAQLRGLLMQTFSSLMSV